MTSRLSIIFIIISHLFIGLLVVFLTLSGVIDFFAIVNDTRGTLPDIQVNADAKFIVDHTKKEAIILNSRWLYHPASLAGRLILAGYPYFTWSYGYDKGTRESIVNAIYNAPTINDACELLSTYFIDIVEIHREPEEYIQINQKLWHSLKPIYSNTKSGYTFYDKATICAN